MPICCAGSGRLRDWLGDVLDGGAISAVARRVGGCCEFGLVCWAWVAGFGVFWVWWWVLVLALGVVYGLMWHRGLDFPDVLEWCSWFVFDLCV